MYNTPILFIIFNRPDTTLKVFEVIKKIKPKELYIAADGPRNYIKDEKTVCQETRELVLNSIDWDCKVHTLLKEGNVGCQKGVSSAISWFFENVEAGIILEDDCVPALDFFEYCELMLSKYKNYPNIGMISGTNYLLGNNGNSQLFFFSKYFAIWGWATWREKWCLYQNDLPDWPLQKKNKWLASIFQNKNIVKYYTFVFDKMIDGYFDTWDVNWTYYLLKYNQLTITPIENLISNIGVTGTHMEGANPNFFNMPKGNFDKQNTNTPREVAQDKILDDIQFNNTGISQYSWKITFRLFLSQLHLLSIVLRFKKALKL